MKDLLKVLAIGVLICICLLVAQELSNKGTEKCIKRHGEGYCMMMLN